MFITYLLFVVGFFILIKGADLLIVGAASMATKLKISDLVVGLTIVAFGTSAPELIVNVFASLEGSTDLAIGNILGSNIANILLILGIASIICPLSVQKNTTYREIPFSLLAALVLGILVNDQVIDGYSFSILSRSDGLTLLSFFIIFLYYVFTIARQSGEEGDGKAKLGWLKSIIFVVLGLTGLTFGGKWIVDGAIVMAREFDVSESFIGLTIVAFGTSLPELATSAVAAWKRNTDIAIGNVVGSNIFNIFWILGISSLIKPLPFSILSNSDIIMTIFASILLFSFLFVGKVKHRLERNEGIFFIILYVAYIGFVFWRG